MRNVTKRYIANSVVIVVDILGVIPLLKYAGLNNWVGILVSVIILFIAFTVINKVFADTK